MRKDILGEEKQSILRHLQEYEKKAMAAEKIRYRRKGKCMSNLDKFNYECEGQMSLMDLLSPEEKVFKPGDWIEKENVGEQLAFEEITHMIGRLIVMDKSTTSHEWYKVVRVEQIVMVESNTQRRLVYCDGAKQRGMVNEMYFDETIHSPARAFRLKA